MTTWKQNREAFIREARKLYETMGTLEISHVMNATQSAVHRALEGVEKRSSLEERRLNRAYKERREEELGTGYCPQCGLQYINGSCEACKQEPQITEHQAWLEFERGWAQRNLTGTGGGREQNQEGVL